MSNFSGSHQFDAPSFHHFRILLMLAPPVHAMVVILHIFCKDTTFFLKQRSPPIPFYNYN